MSVYAVQVHIPLAVGAITEKRKSAVFAALRSNFPINDMQQPIAAIVRNDKGHTVMVSPNQISFVMVAPFGQTVNADFSYAADVLNQVLDVNELGLDPNVSSIVVQLEATEDNSDPLAFLERVNAPLDGEFFGGGIRLFVRENGQIIGEFKAETLAQDVNKSYFVVQLNKQVSAVNDLERIGPDMMRDFTERYIPMGRTYFSN